MGPVGLPFDETKLGELVLYISRRSDDDSYFGKTKLVKLLAFIDFAAFGRSGEPITGATYVKLEYGPAPKQLPPTLNLLKARGDLRIAAQDALSQEQIRVLAVREADTTVFSDAELALVDEVIDHYRSWPNGAMSEESHKEFVGWRMVDDGEEIPYGTVFLSPEPPSMRAIEVGRHVAVKLGLSA